MLSKPICLNYKHEIALSVYLDMITTTIQDITKDEAKYNNFIDVANIIIDHHNNYKSDVLGVANYSDFMSLIPTHFTSMINGYLTGIENETNRSTVRVYKHLLSEEAFNFIDKIQSLDLEIEKDI